MALVAGGHKSHSRPVPYLGGAAITISFAAVVLVAALVYRPTGGLGELGAILGVAVGLSVIGLADDLRGLGAWPRILGEVVAGAVLWWVGSGTQLTELPWADLLLTVLWVVAVTNAFNLLDNME